MLCETLVLATVGDELEGLTLPAVLPVPPVANLRFRSGKIASRTGIGDGEGDITFAPEGSPPLCRVGAVTAWAVRLNPIDGDGEDP